MDCKKDQRNYHLSLLLITIMHGGIVWLMVIAEPLPSVRYHLVIMTTIIWHIAYFRNS